jgi:ABC-type Fe3+-hydroxamate transport system substrate-binding protein
MSPRWLLALALTLVGVGSVFAPACKGGERSKPATGVAAARIISLSPAITETLFALDAGERLVGVALRSDYPAEAQQLPTVGAGTSPDLEAIARLRPTLILSEETKILPAERLAPLAPTRLLPWLSPAEIVKSIRELGAIVDRRARAEELASTMERRFQAKPSSAAPRVLMLFVDQPGRVGPMYFAKPDSLHGAMLVAGGARNAVEEEVRGAPTLSIEGLLQLDPDAILLLVSADELSAETRAQFLADFRELSTLRAVRENRIRILNGNILYVTGPRVLLVIDKVAAALAEMGLVRSP